MYELEMGDGGAQSATCWHSNATSSYGSVRTFALGDPRWMRQYQYTYGSTAKASFEQVATFAGHGRGYLAVFACAQALDYFGVGHYEASVAFNYVGTTGCLMPPPEEEYWSELALQPIEFNKPLVISAAVRSSTLPWEDVAAHAYWNIEAMRVYDSDMRIVGQWTQLIQAPTATYVTTLATPEPSTVTTLGLGALALGLLRRKR